MCPLGFYAKYRALNGIGVLRLVKESPREPRRRPRAHKGGPSVKANGALLGQEQVMSRKTSKENILPSVARDLSIFTKPLLLRSECEHEFDELLHALSGEIQPRGIVENLYVEEIAGIIWEILRLRRCKVTIMNMSFEKVLHNLISLHLKMRRPAREEESKTDGFSLELWQPPTKSEIERSKKI